jgi:hypothetical protein
MNEKHAGWPPPERGLVNHPASNHNYQKGILRPPFPRTLLMTLLGNVAMSEAK